jgi:hypothetical protein
MERISKMPADSQRQQLSSPDLQLQLRQLDALRLARLRAHLRQREPDAHVGYSLLIFRIDDGELREALLGEPPELVEEVPGYARATDSLRLLGEP